MIAERHAYLLLTLFLGGFYTLTFLRIGWIPHDEGVMAQMAGRVLQGEVPHRDFDEPYTGGLTLLHSASMRAFGERLVSLRFPLFAGYLLFLIALFQIALRWLVPRHAMWLVLFCVPWGLSAYFAPMPSWYNSFFAAFGLWALLKFHETDRRYWLAFAGVLGGVSFGFKIAGLYFLIAGLLFLFYRSTAASGPVSRFSKFICVGMALGIAIFLIALVGNRLDINTFVQFVLPGTLLAAFPLLNTRLPREVSTPLDLRQLGLDGALLIGCFLLPLLFGVLAFMSVGSVKTLWTGLFVTPQLRYALGFHPLLPFWTVFSMLPFALMLFWPAQKRGPWFSRVQLALAIGLLLMAATGHHMLSFRYFWATLRPLIPLLAVVGAYASWKRASPPSVYLVWVVMAFTSLVQFPHSYGIYFFYIAPFVALAWAALVANERKELGRVPLLIFFSFGLFGFLWVNRVDFPGGMNRHVPQGPLAKLLPDRADLWVKKESRDVYENLVRVIQARSSSGEAIYAGPDTPEVYFLAERKNPTRLFYEFFSSQDEHEAQILKFVDAGTIRLVVLNGAPSFSPSVRPAFYHELHKRLPQVEDVGVFRCLSAAPSRRNS